MALAETSTRIAERFHSRMRLREEAVPEIMAELKYFKNEKFKRRVAELCHWCVLQLGKLDESLLSFKRFSIQFV